MITEIIFNFFLAVSGAFIKTLSLDEKLLSATGTATTTTNTTGSGANNLSNSYEQQKLLFVVTVFLAHTVPFYTLSVLHEFVVSVVPIEKLAKWRFNGTSMPERSLVLKAFLLTFVYHALLPIFMWFYGADAVLSRNPKLFDTAQLPTIPIFLLQLAACYAFTDMLFYASHRALHEVPMMYSLIHKLHHTFIFTVPVAAEYAHPLEWVVGNVIPVSFACFVFRFHAVVWFVWLTVAIIGTTVAHSGIKLTSKLRDAQWHDFHHSHNVGNYGHSQLWDTLLGTKRVWNRYWAEKDANARSRSRSSVAETVVSSTKKKSKRGKK